MTAPLRPARTALISGVVGGVLGAVMSAAVNYLIIGMPDSEGVNALNHAISGLISGFLAGFIGLTMHMRKVAAEKRETAPAAEAGTGTGAGATQDA